MVVNRFLEVCSICLSVVAEEQVSWSEAKESEGKRKVTRASPKGGRSGQMTEVT